MKQYDRLKTEYLCYLMNRVQVEAEGARGYLELCKMLQNTAFVPILYMDENRSYECRELHREFAEAYDEPEGTADILDGLSSEYGSMMEILVILADKMTYELSESEYEAGVGKWFAEMLENCGLLEYDNETFESDTDGSSDYVNDILATVIFRKYGWDGEGGLFPLRYPKGDQRYEELITQMNDYIEENYDIC